MNRFHTGGIISTCIILNLLVPISFACNQQRSTAERNSTPGRNGNSTEEIRIFLENYYSAMSERNWEVYRTFFSDEATLTTIWAVDSVSAPKIHTSSISDFIAQTKDGPDSQPIFEEKMLSSDISVKGDLAQAWVKYEARFGSTDNLMEWTGTDLFSFIYFNNEWKIVSIVFSPE